MKVPLVDLAAQHAALREEILGAIAGALDRSNFILGDEVSAFEREFAAFQKVPHMVGVASGTDALVLALRALDLKPGESVATVPHTFIATVDAIRALRGIPVLVDVDERTQTMHPAQLDEAAAAAREAGRALRAAIPVHLGGRLADMEAIGRLATENGFAVIEDACQAHGAERGGRRAGAFGCAAAFSFYPTKNLGALGDAGAIATADPAMDEKLRLLRDHGRRGTERYLHHIPGQNSRLSAFQAAALRVKLKHLERWNARRREIARLYRERLAGLDEIVPPPDEGVGDHVYHLFSIRVGGGKRDAVQRYLADRGIGAAIHYPVPLHLQPAYRSLGYGEGSFPATEALARSVLSLPMYPEMTDEQVVYVAGAVKEALAT